MGGDKGEQDKQTRTRLYPYRYRGDATLHPFDDPGNGVVFTSDRPYTALHNEGGNFAVTVRSHSRTSKKTGNTYTVRSHSRQMNMPQRQFIGDHEKVQQALGDIVFKRLQEFSQRLADDFNRH